MGATGFEPVTSSVSGHARPFARSLAAPHSSTSALLKRATEPSTAVRREAAYGIAADKLLTAGRELHTKHQPELDSRELHSIWRTSVRAGDPMADRCSFCGSTAGPFSKVEGLHGADVPGRPRPRQRPLSGDDPVGAASRPGHAVDLGAGAEGGRQPPAHRGHAPTTGCRRAGGSHVPGARGWPGWSGKPRSPKSWWRSGSELRKTAQDHDHTGRETRTPRRLSPSPEVRRL